ncbi:MOSC domain-containing protein [Rhodobacteraceae bacterium CH30]|nr:MOSC domain-containing protein [Rhodobacteraceae bacterium CH30]
MHSPLNGLFIGQARTLPPDGQSSGIFKQRVDEAWLGVEGFAGDEQADRRFHGGREKAVHLYPAEHYDALAQAFPAAAAVLAPGCLGENLSAYKMDEHSVHIGDVFELGKARIQLCSPRSPCWKINHRLDVTGASQWISDQARTGWYARVLCEGTVRAGDSLTLVERISDIPLHAFWCLATSHRPPVAELRTAANAPGLDPAWQQKLTARCDWLAKLAAQA